MMLSRELVYEDSDQDSCDSRMPVPSILATAESCDSRVSVPSTLVLRSRRRNLRRLSKNRGFRSLPAGLSVLIGVTLLFLVGGMPVIERIWKVGLDRGKLWICSRRMRSRMRFNDTSSSL